MMTTLTLNRLVKQKKAFESRIQIPPKHIQYLLHHTLLFISLNITTYENINIIIQYFLDIFVTFFMLPFCVMIFVLIHHLL